MVGKEHTRRVKGQACEGEVEALVLYPLIMAQVGKFIFGELLSLFLYAPTLPREEWMDV